MLFLPPPVLLWDADNVLYKWEHNFARRVLEVDANYPILPVGTRTGFEAGVTGKYREVSIKVKTAPGFYLELEPMEGAKEAMKEIEKFGFLNFVCTAPALDNPTCASDKYAAIKRDFGKVLSDRTIITKDKTLARGEGLIDDKSEVTGIMDPVWQHIIYDRSFNRHVLDKPRMNSDWSNWEEILTPIKKAYEERLLGV